MNDAAVSSAEYGDSTAVDCVQFKESIIVLNNVKMDQRKYIY